jgi:hypothetical protein
MLQNNAPIITKNKTKQKKVHLYLTESKIVKKIIYISILLSLESLIISEIIKINSTHFCIDTLRILLVMWMITHMVFLH